MTSQESQILNLRPTGRRGGEDDHKSQDFNFYLYLKNRSIR